MSQMFQYFLAVLCIVSGTACPADAGNAKAGLIQIQGISLSNSTFVGGAADGTVVGAISVTVKGRAGFTGTLSLSGADAARFRLSSSTLPANLLTNGVQSAGSYSINIVATQSGALGSPKTVPFTITGTGAASVSSVSLSNNTFAGNSPDGTVVGNIGVTLSSGTFGGTLSLSGADAASFRLSNSVLPSDLLLNGTVAAGTYSINIVATQTGLSNSPFSSPKTITGSAATVSISSVTLSNSTFPGGSVAGTVVGGITVAMSSGSFTGSLSLSGTDASKFAISGTNLVLAQTVAAGSYSINIVATQGGASNSPFSSAKTITGSSSQTSTLIISGQSNQTYSGLNISTTSGPCIEVTNSSNITIKNSQIGPCGTNNSTANSQGIYIHNNTGPVNIYDSYIHVENQASNCDPQSSHDNIFVLNNGTAGVNVQGNVVAYGQSNMRSNQSSNIQVVGNYFLNPRGSVACSDSNRLYGNQFQAFGGIPISNFAVNSNYLWSSTTGFTYAGAMTDAINFGNDVQRYTTGITASNNWIGVNAGLGVNQFACGLIQDYGAHGATFSGNKISETHNCGIGIADGGIAASVANNKVLLSQNTTGFGAGISITQPVFAGSCVTSITGNYVTAFQGATTGTPSGWNQAGYNDHSSTCQPSGVTPVTNFVNSGGSNVIDTGCSGSGCVAYNALNPMATTNPPPLIPPLPFACVAVSPYSTQTSKPSC